MLLIYTPILKPRIQYIFELFFKEILCVEYKCTQDAEHFSNFIGPKLNYSESPQDKELFIQANGLLNEKGIHPQNILIGEYQKLPTIFAYQEKMPASILPFDIFAASFYLVTRYEEYLNFVPDEHGRFPSTASIAHQQRFLDKPLINIWAKQLLEIIREQYPRLESHYRKFQFIPTYDIDIAYSYRCKGLFRNVGGYLKDFKNFNFTKLKERTKVLMDLQEDPFDTYGHQHALQEKYSLKPIYFFLLGQYGPYDKNISVDRTRFQDLIQSVSDYASIGIHPSYRSNDHLEELNKEVKDLARIIKREISQSRQHYVRLNFPQTYERLLELNITKDYSMGYADQVGFRASIASSFLFYNLSQESTTNLRIYPFSIMDVTYRFYQQNEISQTLDSIQKIIQSIKAVNGIFIPIFHNSSLSETDGWEGWRVVHEQMIKMATT